MKIQLSPVRTDDRIEYLERRGSILVVNGEPFDFSPLREGDVLPGSAIDSKWFTGPVELKNGELHLTLMLPHGGNAPERARFPEPIDVTEDGEITLPPYSLEE